MLLLQALSWKRGRQGPCSTQRFCSLMCKEMLKRADGVRLSEHVLMLMLMLMLARNWAIALIC